MCRDLSDEEIVTANDPGMDTTDVQFPGNVPPMDWGKAWEEREADPHSSPEGDGGTIVLDKDPVRRARIMHEILPPSEQKAAKDNMSPASEQPQPLITNIFTHEARVTIAKFLREHEVADLRVTEAGFSLEDGSSVSDAAVNTLIHSNFILLERLFGDDESLRH